MSDKLAVMAPAGPLDVADLMRHAIDKGVSVEALEKLVTLHERLADRVAASEFAQAMADFQSECPAIPKSSRASINTKSGARYSYQYAELPAIARVVNPLLAKRGLSYTWDSDMTEAGLMHCVCTLRHVNGHSISASFTAPLDEEARMSVTQKGGAALTFAKRQSLVQVLGLTTTDPDTDLAGAGSTDSITAKQEADLDAMISEVNADRARFLKYMGVEALDQLRASDYSRAVAALNAKRKA